MEVPKIKVPEILVLEFKKMPALGAALEKRINEVNPNRLLPVSTATKYIISLIEKDVSTTSAPEVKNTKQDMPGLEYFN